jgi:hypothetical protein
MDALAFGACVSHSTVSDLSYRLIVPFHRPYVDP